MEGLKQKKTVYLEALENLESKIKDLNTDLTPGGMKFFLLYLLYETQQVCEFFVDVEKKVSEKVFTPDILEIDANVDYKEWSNISHWKFNFEVQSIPEDSAFEPIEKAIWGMLDALPPNDSEQYVEFSRTEYKQVLQQILWSKCSNKQLFYALANLIKQLQITLYNIGDKQAKRDLSLEDGEKLYKGEEMQFNLSEAAKVLADFKKWKSDCEDDEEIILKRIEGKKLAEIKNFFHSGFLACKIEQQNEVDFSDYKEELDFNRLKGIAEGLNVEAYYSAMREFFKFNKGVLTPRKDKIGKFFFKHRKEVTIAHRVALFRFVKMIWLIEEEKKPKPQIAIKEKKGQKIVVTTSTSLFYKIIQHEEPEKLIKRLHQLIDGRKGADVGCVLLKCFQDGHLTRKPTQKEFESEFTLIGGWKAIHNYMNDNSANALDRANKIIIF